MRANSLVLAIALGLGATAVPTDAAHLAGPRAGDRVDDLRVWIVVFDEPAAASFRGFGSDTRRPKLSATSAAVTGADRYDPDSVAAREYVAYLADLRRVRLDEMAARLGRDVRPKYVYSHATNGVALALTAREAAIVGGVPGVRLVSPDTRRRVQTSTSPQWIGADEVWNGTIAGVGSHRGEGVVIGVIDTGIHRTHTAFSGAGITNPRAGFLGYCTLNAAACNSKLIGLWDFIADTDGFADPVDTNGHGTHTASTAGGNPFSGYSGVAPRANLIAYKACGSDDCDTSALLKAIDQAVDDAVDVINYSIGGEATDPWLRVANPGAYDDSEAFLAAREAGIVVAASAGNDGPSAGTLGNPANTPWVIAVANASDDGNGAANADRLAASSGRGPVIPFGVVKPDITAPGTNIQAAGTASTTAVATMSGTSMAAPHVAGAAALLLSANPSRTADQIISALMLTARNSVKISALVAADPHDQGAGMVDVALAARAGLYLQMAPGAFAGADADPFGGTTGLNLPSLGHGACFQSCTITRTFRLMPGASAATYNISVTVDTPGATVTPSVTSFTSSAAGTTIGFTADVDAPTLLNRWVYGWVTLTNTSGDGRPNLRLPLAVYSTPYEDAATEAALSGADHVVAGERGYFDLNVGGTVPLPDARFATTALVTPTRTVQNIALDPSEDDPYDTPVGTYVRTFTTPTTPTATTYRIGASTRQPDSDIDLYVGRDSDGDGLPEASEELCMSASADGDEDCEFEVTLTTGATFWVVAQNFSGGGLGTVVDSHVLPMTAADAPELTATGPGNIPLGTPFSIRVAYDDPTLVDGQRRIAALLIQRTPGDTALTVPFTLERDGTESVAFGLAPGVARRVSLPAGANHGKLYVDLPPGVTQATFRTQNGSGSVSLYASHTTIPAGPVVEPAPPTSSADHVAAAAGANQTITVNNPAAGRWYLTPVNTGGSVATVDVVATINTVNSGAVPALRRGSYYNPTRGGHGIFLYPSGSEHALLWYTYLQDGTPTWYYAQGPQPNANQVWNGAVYRAAWNGTSRILERIGNLVLTPSATGQMSLTYNIDGFTGAETLDTFLTGCPMHAGSPLDVSAHWYDNDSPGYGYSVQVNPNYEFLATFVYDGIGVPRFLAAERGGAFQGDNTTVPLDQLAGFAPLGAHSAPVRTTIGQLTRTYGVGTIESIGTTATFVDGVPGTWSRSANAPELSRLSDQPQGCN